MPSNVFTEEDDTEISTTKPTMFAVGELVKALWSDKQYYQGTITAIKSMSPMKYSVHYEAHNKSATVPEAGIRKNDFKVPTAAEKTSSSKKAPAGNQKAAPTTTTTTTTTVTIPVTAPVAALSPLDALKAKFAAVTTEETATDFATAVVKFGLPLAFAELKLNDTVAANLDKDGKAFVDCRKGSLFCVTALTQQSPAAANFLIPVIPALIKALDDKMKPVADAAATAFNSVIDLCIHNVSLVLPMLIKSCLTVKGNLARFEAIQKMCVASPEMVSTLMAVSVAAVVPFMINIKKPVEEAAKKTLAHLCSTCSNPDLIPFFPALESCMEDQTKVAGTLFDLASSTFVAEVDGATLALLSPVLVNGLQTKSAGPVKRQCARIIENMCKLVDEPRFVVGLIANVLPLLENAKKSVSDPEARAVCEKAFDVLAAKGQQAKPLTFNVDMATTTIHTLVSEVPAHMEYVYQVVAAQCAMLNEINEYEPAVWEKKIIPFLINSGAMEEKSAQEFCTKIHAVAHESRVEKQEEEQDDGAEILCDLGFGLAYGNKVLLRKTKLKLLRGHRYGLLGQNDSGKTSLLRALADYKIEGFPTAEECRTVFVATDINTELADLSVIDYMFNDPLLKNCGVSREAMAEKLESVGFKEGAPANTRQAVGTLSGGWRMKLALSRAMLLKADILLLDEPTNHLDTFNVKWVESYLLSLKDVTCIMVSHDSGLLTRVCTDIIEIDTLKLNYHRGSLATFVEMRPEAKCYFELPDEGSIDFSFPNPGPLPGVKSKGKTILQMNNITFTYPGADKPQLTNVSVIVSLSSRVACVGENGAGKSTMIKLLTGELEPDAGSGTVVKHPNCRVGYIAQHAFHHIENHLEKTANDYIRWRFANGGDAEELVKVTSKATPEEEKKMVTPFEYVFVDAEGNGLKKKVVVERFTERRRDVKSPAGQEYEVSFVGSTALFYINRKVLIEQGWEKPIKSLDERIALRATQFARPLTKENVQKHLEAVGLAPEFSTHMRIGALSGGQKVKVVLASALWSQPHILILDEPTNYLDRESLGALARAIRKFEGGVVMITHNSQFCDNLCPVVWHLQNNTLDVKGDAQWMAEAAKAAIVVSTISDADMVDKFGNTIELKTKGNYTKKELKAKKDRRAKRTKANGGDDFDSDDEE